MKTKQSIFQRLGSIVCVVLLMTCTMLMVTPSSAENAKKQIFTTGQNFANENAVAVIANPLVPAYPDNVFADVNNQFSILSQGDYAAIVVNYEAVKIESKAKVKGEIQQDDHPTTAANYGKGFYPSDHPASFSTMLLKNKQVKNLAFANADPKILVSA